MFTLGSPSAAPAQTWQVQEEIAASLERDSWLGFLKRAWRWSRVLNTEVNRSDFRWPMKLKEALGLLYEHCDAKGIELQVLVNAQELGKQLDNDDSVYDCEIDLTALPKGATLSRVLTEIIRQLPCKDGTVVLRRTYFEITTVEAAAGQDRSFYALSGAAPIAKIWLWIAVICAVAYLCLRLPANFRRDKRKLAGLLATFALAGLVLLFWPVWLITLGFGLAGRRLRNAT